MKRTITLLLTLALCMGLLGTAASAASLPFTDVEAGAYYYDPVAWAVEKNVTTGTTATTFSPENTCTRNQVVTFLWRAMGEPEPAATANPFVDVKADDYFYKAVLWAVEENITNGVDATHFGPENSCTRAQVATFLWRTMGSEAPVSTKHPFTDIDSKQYYYNAVLWAVENDVTKGMTDTTFAPENTCTRGQIVTFLHRTLKDVNKPSEPTVPPTSPTEPVAELVFKSEPADVKVKVNEKATFKVEVEGGMPELSYQWQYKLDGEEFKNFTKDQNAWATGWNTSELSAQISETDFAKHFTVRCVVTDVRGVSIVSKSAAVTEKIDLAITVQPASVNYVEDNQTLTLSVEVTGGTAPYSFVWQIHYSGFEPFDVTKEASTMNIVEVVSDGNKSTMTLAVDDSFLDQDKKFNCLITDAEGEFINSDYSEAKNVAAFTIQSQPVNFEVYGGAFDYIPDASGVKYGYGLGDFVTEHYIELDGGVEPYTYTWQYRAADTYANMEVGWQNIDNNESASTASLYADFTKDQLCKGVELRCLVADAIGNQKTSNICRAVFSPMTVTKQPKNVAFDASGITFDGDFLVGGGCLDFNEVYSFEWFVQYQPGGEWISCKNSTFYTDVDKKNMSIDEGLCVFKDILLTYTYKCKITDSVGNEIWTDTIKVTE